MRLNFNLNGDSETDAETAEEENHIVVTVDGRQDTCHRCFGSGRRRRDDGRRGQNASKANDAAKVS